MALRPVHIPIISIKYKTRRYDLHCHIFQIAIIILPCVVQKGGQDDERWPAFKTDRTPWSDKGTQEISASRAAA